MARVELAKKLPRGTQMWDVGVLLCVPVQGFRGPRHPPNASRVRHH